MEIKHQQSWGLKIIEWVHLKKPLKKQNYNQCISDDPDGMSFNSGFLVFFTSLEMPLWMYLFHPDSLNIYFYTEAKYILSIFKALWVGQRVHQSTSRTPPTGGRSMYAIQNNSFFLGLYELVDECTSSLVEHLPHMNNPCMQSRTTHCF